MSLDLTKISDRVKKELPPNIRKIKKFYPDFDPFKVAVTYYPYIYFQGVMSPDLFAHEMKHIEQQERITPEKWWENFFAFVPWRLEQEIAAYRSQLHFVKNRRGDKKVPIMYQRELAGFLSGPLYGRVISYEEAIHILKV